MKKQGMLVIIGMSAILAFAGCSKKQSKEVNNPISESVEERKTTEEQDTTGRNIINEENAETSGDTTPPVIEGTHDITVEIGGTISYKKGVTVTDDCDDEVSLEIDKEQVDINKAGTYTVTYTAEDSAGNKTVKEIKVNVTDQKIVTEEEVIAMADEVMAEVITDDMTLWTKAYKLLNWCRTKIIYSTTAGDRTSKYTGAYEGLHNRSGDCYVYYATYSVFLDRLGVENIQVARIGGTSNHWWNLVNLGDGWYHCDSSPRSIGDKYRCFMQTDAQIAEYTENYTALHPEKPNYFTFDTTLYPERETKIVYSGYNN